MRSKRIAGNGKLCLINYSRGCACANGSYVVAEGMFVPGAIATGGRWSHQATLVGWMSGSWTEKGWDRFGWWPLRLGGGGIILVEGLHDLGRRSTPLLNHTLAFTLQQTEELRQGSRVVKTTRFTVLAVFFGTASAGPLSISPPRLPVSTSVSPWSAQVPSKLPN
jgi:hypothetical protein